MISSDCIEVYPDRAAWLAARRSVLVPSTVNAGRAKLGYPPVPEPDGSRQVSWPVEHRIGASDIGRILGRSPHGGPWDVWLDKREGRAEEDTADMAQGRRWERRVLEDYAEATGAFVQQPAVWASYALDDLMLSDEHILIRHPEHAWATCSPDGFAEHMPSGCRADPTLWTGVECKAVMDPGAAAEWAEETQVIEPGHDGAWPAPLHYVLQVYWSMAVTGLPFWDLAAILMPRRGRLVYHRFIADPGLQGALLAQVGEWRERHLERGEEPPVDDSAAAWSYYASRDHAAPLREASPEEAALAGELHRATRDEAEAKARKERVRNELAARMRDVAGIALGPAVGRKKPPRAVWQTQAASSYVVNRPETSFIRLWGLSTEEET